MAVPRVQHVTQAASEGLNAGLSDLCDAPGPMSSRTSKRTVSKLTAKSWASSAATRPLQHQERSVFVSSPTSSADDEDDEDDASLMLFIPLTAEPSSLFKILRSSRLSKLEAMGSPSTSAGVDLACHSAARKTGVTKKLLRLCLGSRASKYTPLPVT